MRSQRFSISNVLESDRPGGRQRGGVGGGEGLKLTKMRI
jgi:hypothetical protein